MDVGEWLRGIGLQQYAGLFRDNEIQADVLPDLTDQHLKDLGVSLGHRLKLLRAIREVAASGPVAVQAASPPPPKPQESAERRQLTVMFCDLVGSTALSAKLDPEDMSDLIRAFQGAVAAAAAQFDGHVAKFMGDGALVYFGYPRAHEDNAERAARAGLSLSEAVRSLGRDRGIALEARAGIATGLVVVGELMGEGEARERGVVGETPNLAARLQAFADPGSVVVAQSTRRLLGTAFELKPLSPKLLKGFETPIFAWSVLSERENVTRFEASRSAGMTPFVGREQEVALLLERWRDAMEGEGQVVLLSGEAGIGKSRILAALRARIGNEPHIPVNYQCSPHHVNDAFYPIIGQIWQVAGFVAGEPAAARLDKIEAMVALWGFKNRDLAPYLASLLSIPAQGRYPALEMAPSDLKERTVTALLDGFVELTQASPVLALLEDAHWMDPSSLDLFSRLIERARALRALIVVTFRPEFMVPWHGQAHVTALALNRFGRRQAVAMIERLTAGKALPAEVLDQIVVKTDGVPLFVEELTKTVLESDLLREEDGAYVLAAPLSPLMIPSTLQDSLMARLDRLAPIKEIAQIGAAIGREFPYRLLEAVAPITGPALQNALHRLMASDLIYGRGTPPDSSYVFKHALVQDTAYASLLRSRRQHIHAAIARALTEHFADQVESAPAIVAHHYREAGLAEPAARNWLAAAELALSRSAPVEAARHVETGLELITRLEKGLIRHSLELALRLANANALKQLKGFGAPETITALTEAKRILDSGIGNDLQRLSVLQGLCSAYLATARIEPGLTLAGQIVEVANRQDDAAYKIVGYRLLGSMQVFAGRNRESLRSLLQGEKYRDPDRQKLLSYRFATDPGLAVLCYKLWVLLLLGLFNQAERLAEQLKSEFANHPHAPTVASCKLFACVLPPFLLGDFEACERHGAELVAYSLERKVEQFRLLGVLYHSCARAMCEPIERNFAAIREAMEAHHRSGGSVCDSFFQAHLIDALLMNGDATRAQAELQECFAFVETSGERYWLAELHRLDGQIALRRLEPDRARAQTCFARAIEIAHKQEARLLELRAAIDLARLWRDTSSGGDAGELLEPILAAIEGGANARDVRAARALLAAPA